MAEWAALLISGERPGLLLRVGVYTLLGSVPPFSKVGCFLGMVSCSLSNFVFSPMSDVKQASFRRVEIRCSHIKPRSFFWNTLVRWCSCTTPLYCVVFVLEVFLRVNSLNEKRMLNSWYVVTPLDELGEDGYPFFILPLTHTDYNLHEERMPSSWSAPK